MLPYYAFHINGSLFQKKSKEQIIANISKLQTGKAFKYCEYSYKRKYKDDNNVIVQIYNKKMETQEGKSCFTYVI